MIKRVIIVQLFNNYKYTTVYLLRYSHIYMITMDYENIIVIIL